MVNRNAQYRHQYDNWDDESAFIDMEIRSSGHFTLVNAEKGHVRFYPRDAKGQSNLPAVLNMQISLNGNALGKLLFHDLIHEAGYNPPETTDEDA